jgi:hypothetical protein
MLLQALLDWEYCIPLPLEYAPKDSTAIQRRQLSYKVSKVSDLKRKVNSKLFI